MIVGLTLRYILILVKWRWRRWILRKWHLIFIIILSWSVHDTVKLLIKLLFLEIHGMENFLSALLLVIIHMHWVMMRSMVSLKKMRFLWVSHQSTSKHLPSFVQVLFHLPGFIFKSFNFIKESQIAHLKKLSLLRILNTCIKCRKIFETLLVNFLCFFWVATQNLLMFKVGFNLLLCPDLVNGLSEILGVLVVLNS